MPPEAMSEKAPMANQRQTEFDPTRWIEALPFAGLLVSVTVGVIYGFPTGLIVLGATLLLLGIWNLWVSLQLVAGDRPRPAETTDVDAPSYEEEQKLFLLRALDDLEFERSVGKIDEDDYEVLKQQYRERARKALEAEKQANDPLRQRAESVVRSYLEEHGLNGPSTASKAASSPERDNAPTQEPDEGRGKS